MKYFVDVRALTQNIPVGMFCALESGENVFVYNIFDVTMKKRSSL